MYGHTNWIVIAFGGGKLVSWTYGGGVLYFDLGNFYMGLHIWQSSLN